MLDFFFRNLTQPTKEKILPEYLKPFKWPEEDDAHELFELLMNEEYDIVLEE